MRREVFLLPAIRTGVIKSPKPKILKMGDVLYSLKPYVFSQTFAYKDDILSYYKIELEYKHPFRDVWVCGGDHVRGELTEKEIKANFTTHYPDKEIKEIERDRIARIRLQESKF